MVIIPVIHISPMQTDTIVPFIIINLSTESIFLSKCEVLGFLDQTDTKISKMTSSALESLALGVIAEQPENPLPYREADISVHRKVDLKDAEVNENILEMF